MDREDAKKVIKELSEKPFICADNWIEVGDGYPVTTKEHFKKLEKSSDQRKGGTTMKMTYICSPCLGDYEKNIIKAQEYCREALLEGLLPIAPHVYFTQFVDDKKPEERELGLFAGLQLLRYCQLIRVYGCHVSAGMYNEIQLAGVLGIELEVYGPPEFVELVKEIYNNATVTQKAPTLRRKRRSAGVSAGAPSVAPLTKEPDINPAAGAACININLDEVLTRELEKKLATGNALSRIIPGGA